MSDIPLIGKERVVPNTGNKRCRICGALITDECIVTNGTNNRHLTCNPRPSKSRVRSLRATIRKPGRVNHSRYLSGD